MSDEAKQVLEAEGERRADPEPEPRRVSEAATEDEGGAETDLALEPEIACELVSEHGGEIVILDDGRVVFMNAAEHLVEIAHALDPHNPEISARMEVIERVRRERAQQGDATIEVEPDCKRG